MTTSGSRKAIIRVDASVHIGSGHVMRCLVLASVLQQQGVDVFFVMRLQQGDLLEFVAKKGFEVRALPAVASITPEHSGDYEAWLQTSIEQDVCDFFSLADVITVGPRDMVIVDHYGITKEWETSVKLHYGCKLIAIDDLVRPHNVDLIIDQTLGREVDVYQPSNAERILTGVEFALLNKHFVHVREKSSCASNDMQQGLALSEHKILLSMGGIDQPNATLKVLQTLKQSGVAEQTFDTQLITVLLSPKAAHYESVSVYCQQESDWVQHIDFVDDMASMMQQHTLAIGAPGTTSWERACLGLPSIIVPLADNQKYISQALVEQGLSLLVELDDIPSKLGASLKTLIQAYPKMRQSNLAACDGRGVYRVAYAINQLFQTEKSSLQLVKATKRDISLVYDWQCHPSTRQYALNSATPTWEEHKRWMTKKLASIEDYFYFIEECSSPNGVKGKKLGVIRLDRQQAGNYLVSIFIDPDCYGQGIARKGLNMLDAIHPEYTLHAQVLPQNTASHKLFQQANYEQRDPENYIRYPLERGSL